MTRRPARALVAAAVLTAATPVGAAAQRAAFVDAFVEFHSVLRGTYGDEGPQVVAALDRMAASLDEWERASRAAEAALDARADATPAERALLYADQQQWAEAIAAMRAAIAAEPQRAALHLFLGHLQRAAGDVTAAADSFAAARRLDPADPIAAYLVGASLADEGGGDAMAPIVSTLVAAAGRRSAAGPRPFPVFALVDDLSARVPMFAPAAYRDGFASFAAGRFRQAIEQLRAAAAKDPLVADPAGGLDALRLGVAALRSADAASAVAQLEAAVRRLPDSVEAQRVLGIVYHAAGRDDEALERFRLAVNLAPDDERARLTLARALIDAGRLEEAERTLRDTIARLPASGFARWLIADVYERLDRGVEAIAPLAEAEFLLVPAGKVHLQWRLAELWHGYHRDYARVIGVLSRRAWLVPNEPHAHKDLGLAYSRGGRDDAALLELLMATLLGLEDAEMLGVIGHSHLNAGRLEAAEAALRRAVALDPELAQARYALGTALQRLGRQAEAAEHLAAFKQLRAAALDRQRLGFEIDKFAAAALQHVAAGRLVEAAAAYEQAAALGGPAEIYRQLAMVYAKLGRDEDSRRALALYAERRAAPPPAGSAR